MPTELQAFIDTLTREGVDHRTKCDSPALGMSVWVDEGYDQLIEYRFDEGGCLKQTCYHVRKSKEG